MSILSLKNVNYRYPLEEKQVIRNVSLNLEKGKVYGLIGANESGKTSICNILRGLIPQFYRGGLTGEVLLKGKPLDSYSPEQLSKTIGYVFQNPFTQISGVKETVFEEIAYGMENLGMSKEKMTSRVNELVSMFHLEELIDRNPYQLSGGQKQRVALISVLAPDPEIIIMDEPTSQLDPKSTEDIFKVIEIIKKQGKTILLVEHKVDLMAKYCDHIFLMAKGELVMSGSVEQIMTDPKVLEYGGQLPQVVLYFLEQKKCGKTVDQIPLTVEAAYQWLQKKGVK